jgi:hypothetical protein
VNRTEYKRLWREKNRDRYLAKRRVSARRWYANNREHARQLKKARRQKARDRGRCGICVSRYCEPGYSTCLHCLENLNGRRQRKREQHTDWK